MDDLEKKLYMDLNTNMEIPTEFKDIIRKSLNEAKAKKKVEHYKLSKIIVTACASLLITTGIVCAGTVISKNIWKEPEKTVGFYDEQSNSTDIITEKAKEEAISEKEAIKKTEIILEKFGYKNEKIKTAELSNYSNNYELTWRIETKNGIFLEFDARGGNYLNIKFNNILYKDIDKYRSTKKKAEITAREICKKYGYDLTKYDDVKISSNMILEDESYIWYADFKKKYNEFVNPYESIYVGFIPEINELYYFIVYDTKYDDNPINIDKEKAIEIAVKNEEKIDIGYKIKNTSASLNIVKMNGDAYLRSKDYNQYKKQQKQDYPIEEYIEYRTESLVRKAWEVTVEYDIGEEKGRIVDENGITYRLYTYYIDATTGEIIGGTQKLNTYSK